MLVKVCEALSLYLILSLPVTAQIPLGSWREHLPYRQGQQLATANGKIFCSTPYSLIVFDPADNTVERLSKLNGLSEIGISAIASDEQSGKLAVAYKNSNVDVIESNRVYNVNDIKIKNINGDKTIYNIFWYQQFAYLSTGIGVIVLDGTKHEVKDSYVIGSQGSYTKVAGVAADAQYIYAATGEGLKKAPKNSVNLADYRQWSLAQFLPPGACDNILLFNDRLIAQVADTLWISDGNNWKLFFGDGGRIKRIHLSAGKLHVLETDGAGVQKVTIIKQDGSFDRVINSSNGIKIPLDAITVGEQIYLADSASGFIKISGTTINNFTPDSPAAISNGEMIVSNKVLWVAPGGVSDFWEKQNRHDGLFNFQGDQWMNYDSTANPLIGKTADITALAADPVNGEIWAGSFGDGLLRINSEKTITRFRENSFLRPADNTPDFYGIGGLAFDTDDNLWITNYGAASSLLMRKPDGSVRSFVIPGATFDFAFSRIVVDDDNQKWIISPKNNGLFCLNTGLSPDNPADDKWRHYLAGAGNGNLPDNNVLCIAKDKSGFVWAGTAKGIGIIQCTREVFNAPGCEAVLPIVQQDNFAGYLFSNERVQAIAVDGADRKWIGTRNGAWLISPYGDKTISHFTTATSPLLDNDIKNIVIDPGTGEVYFETATGICSFRSNATTQAGTEGKVLVFPNPVPPTFSGEIVIRGLPENSIVKIVETDGRLVYQARSLGTTATWNGFDYKGRKVSGGVYLVLTRDANGKDQLSTKLVIVK